MESKTKFILVLSLFVGLALATEKPDPETMFTTSDEEYEMENHDLSKLDILIIHECLKLSFRRDCGQVQGHGRRRTSRQWNQH